ncbi:MAG TPA: hypothetical protein VK435_02520 [Thermodesulfovibrionales bacterium]|nr:hypothetical protein [Thermodesulfovibrionales bacterium]
MAGEPVQKITYINYASTYYPYVAGIAEPQQYEGKFVQIRRGGTEYLVFSPKEFTRFHADIVQRFCGEHNIYGVYRTENKVFEITDPEWRVTGGGKFAIDREKRDLRIHDNSLAYGKFEKQGLKEKILSVSQLSDYDVRIE